MLALVCWRRSNRSNALWRETVAACTDEEGGTQHRTPRMARASFSSGSDEQQGLDMYELNDAAKAAAALERQEQAPAPSDSVATGSAKGGRLQTSDTDFD